MNFIDDDIPAYKKKSKKKGLPRAKHKHIYETVLLCRNWHYNDFKSGRPKVKQIMTPTKVCNVCGRIDCGDSDPSYYVEKQIPSLSLWLTYDAELSEKALSLPKWYTEDYFDKFAIKMEDESNNSHKDCSGCVYEDADGSTEDIGNCVCCNRMVETAKNDYYRKK